MLRIKCGWTAMVISVGLGFAPAIAYGEDPPPVVEDETRVERHVVESRVHFEFDSAEGAAGDGMFDGGSETDDGMESLSSSVQLGFAF